MQQVIMYQVGYIIVKNTQKIKNELKKKFTVPAA